MNITHAILLFFAAMIPGIAVIAAKKPFQFYSGHFLMFAGTYIFSITVVHLLPDIFSTTSHPVKMGMFVLLGFFFQIFIDFLTSGVEHGHVHHQKNGTAKLSPLLLMTGLTLHAVMDGGVLARPDPGLTAHDLHHSTGLLFGIVMHKIPAAAVLMMVLNRSINNKYGLIMLLLLFSLASPAGLWAGNYLSRSDLLGSETLLIIMAFVSGNFLHISTTIFFESSPDHVYNKKKVLAGIAGALLAVLSEFLPF